MKEQTTNDTSLFSSKRLPFFCIFSCFFLLLLLIISTLISLGKELYAIHPLFGWIYFITCLILLFFAILYPLFSIFSRPVFSMYLLRDSKGRARRYWCKKLVSNLTQHTALSEESKKLLSSYLEKGNEADDLLIAFFTETFSPIIDQTIITSAKTAFSTTAISQTAVYDMLSMLSINLHQIRSIVELCGYRPTTVGLLGLYIRILKAAFLAGGLEEMDLEELLYFSSGTATLKLPGLLLASAAQGTINAFTTIRVGLITKQYLFSPNGPLSMKQARRESYKQAFAFLKQYNVTKDVMANLTKKAATAVKHSAESAVQTTTETIHSTWNRFRPHKSD